MENNHFSIEKMIRGFLGIGRRIYSIAFGIFVIIIGFIPILRKGFSLQDGDTILHETFIIMGVLQIIFGLIGKELCGIRYRLKMDSELLRIKKTFEREILINLNSITHLKTLPMSLEICFDDYVKTYEFNWMTIEEFEKLKVNFSNFCIRKSIAIE